MTSIGIIDYGMGNLRSVQKALERLGAAPSVLASPRDVPGGVATLDKLILPGVGAFADGMAHLRERDWVSAIGEFAATGKPFLGICLGMQLLFEGSQEDAASPSQPVPGLGLLPGQVVRFCSRTADGQVVKVPHMGWNTIRWDRDDPLLRGLPPSPAVYFVHSYYAQPCQTPQAPQSPIASATSEYPSGQWFCASLWRGNLWATQFHPEKSQEVGRRILANFVAM